jgi:hypothetical protein
MSLLELVFRDPWHFVGTVILIGVVTEGVSEVIKAATNRRSKS